MVHATNAVATLSAPFINFEQVDHFAAEMDDFAQCIINYRPRTRISDVQ